jgi:LPXTG-motif cell wall-anchored protein
MIKMDHVSKSMADNAINHTVKLEVIDGEYFVTLDFRGITIENRFGYLKNLSYYADGYTYGQYGTVEGTLVPSEVLSTQKDSDGNDVIDQYNDVNNLYPDIVKIKLVPQAIADEDGYVPLHVFVPIMEAIAAGNGDQDVLMKLDWSTLKATTEENPDFRPEDPVEQSPAVDVTDAATGVKVHADKGVFEEGVKLVVTPITSGADYNLAASALEEVGKKFKLYEIHFDDANGSEVQPNGTVTVSYPIPEGYDAENVALYRINDDGSKTLIKGTVDGNYYTVITKSFSTYALVEKDSTITDDQNIQNVNNGTFGNNSNNNSDNSSNNNDSNVTGSTQDGGVNAPQTGDNSNIALGIMLMFASAGMLAVLTFKRKRRIREGE